MENETTAAPASMQQESTPPTSSTSIQETPGSSDPWYTTLPDDLRSNSNITKFTSVEELAKGYDNASRMLGRDKIPVPQTPEEMRFALQRLGMPEKHTEYKIGPELGSSWQMEDFVSSPEPGVDLAKWKECYKQYAHEFGATQEQAAKMYERVVREHNAQEKRKAARVEAEMVECGTSLRRSWGEAHDINMLIATKAVNNMFSADLVEKINNAGLGRDPEFLMAMHKVGSRSLEELGIDAKGSTSKTPADLDSDIKSLMSHPAYMDKKHPEHKQTVQRVTSLMQRRHPDNA